MAGLDDFQSFSTRLQNELDKLDHHHPTDQPYVKQMVSKLDGHIADSSLSNYLNFLRYIPRVTNQERPIVEVSELEFDEIVYDLRTSPEYGRGGEDGYSDGTVRNVQFAVKKYLTTIDSGSEWAEDYPLLPTQQSTVRPEDMLQGEDIQALVQAANRARDVALIEFLADTGARLSLVGSLRVGDVELEGKKATYTPNPNASGLKGAEIMPYPIIDSRAPLFTYLNTMHPRPDRDDVALFHKLPGFGNNWDDGDGALSPHNIRERLQRAADVAGIEKPVNPHNFRHSAITRMAREEYTRSEIEHRVHWTIDTDMWSVYEHIAGEEHNDAIFEKAGIAASDDSQTAARGSCGNCLETLAPHHEFCPRCGDPVSGRARQAVQETESVASEVMVNSEEQSKRATANVISAIAKSDARVGERLLDDGEDE